MDFFRNLKIKHKLFCLISFNLSFFILVGIFSYIALSNLGNSQQKLIANTTAIYNQMNADMMHDALRADVYKAILLDKQIETEKNILKEEFEGHKTAFHSSLQKLSQLSVNETIDRSITDIAPALNQYSKQAERIIHLAFQNDSSSKKIMEGELLSFHQSFDELATRMSTLSSHIAENSEFQQSNARSIVSTNKTIILISLAFSILVIGLISQWIANQLTSPIIYAKNTLANLAKGDLPTVNFAIAKDETGEMICALKVLITNLSTIKVFATEVGNGKFDSQIMVFNNTGELGTVLGSMRESLKTISEEENKRNWINSGLTQANEILRLRNQTNSSLMDKLLSFIINYMKINQGCISIVNYDNPQDLHMNILACYAYDRKKYINHRFEIGEGLAGQVVLEKEYIYLTNVPDDYIHITSGLGDAAAQAVLILPLKVEDEVLGVLEVASFYEIPSYHIQFLERLCNSLGLYISNENQNIKTERLLQMTQQQKQELQAQEEEVRQNMEELYATQEEIRRREDGYLKRIEELESHINGIGKPYEADQRYYISE